MEEEEERFLPYVSPGFIVSDSFVCMCACGWKVDWSDLFD